MPNDADNPIRKQEEKKIKKIKKNIQHVNRSALRSVATSWCFIKQRGGAVRVSM